MSNWLARKSFPGKDQLKALIGPSRLGLIDYLLDPTLRQSYGGPFNGQLYRRAIVEECLRTVKPAFVVETGTYRGTTTEFFAKFTKVPIHTVEFQDRFFGYSRARLFRYGNVHLYRGDSSAVLRMLFDKGRLHGRPGFFYLDAHWQERLPLADEVDTIFQSLESALVLIDDFQVPDDAGYQFDNYGPGRALTVPYLAAAQSAHRFDLWFPTCASKDETGSRRGCALLSRGPEMSALRELTCIRRWGPEME